MKRVLVATNKYWRNVGAKTSKKNRFVGEWEAGTKDTVEYLIDLY